MVLSLAKMRADGFTCEITERWMRVGPRWMRTDAFSFCDALCFRGKEVVAVQTTDDSNLSKRVKKIKASDWLPILKMAGWTVVAHGWAKPKKRGDEPRLREVIL